MYSAVRALSRDRTCAALAVLSLAAGLGLTASLASVADAILYRPLPVGSPGEIVRVFTSSAAQPLGLVSYPDFDDLRRASRTTALIAQSQILIAVAPGPGARGQMRLGLAVTADYFDVLRVPPAVGRMFRAEEARSAVVVLGHAFWESQFGSDPRAIGGIMELGGAPFTIIGVAAKNFSLDRFAHESFYVPANVYDAGLLPAAGHPTANRAARCLNVYGRLRSGASIDAARAELAAISARLVAEYPATNGGHRSAVMTELDARLRADRTMPAVARLLIGIAALMLAIVCVNVCGLLLVRAEARAKETAVRLAMGASVGTLLRQSLMESAMLSAAGAALGLPLAWAAGRALSRAATLPTDFPISIEPETGARVLIVTALAATVATLVTGAAPVLAALRCNIAQVLKARAGASKSRSRNALAIAEIAFATALAACCGLLIEAIGAAARVDPGFRAAHVLTMALDPSQIRGESEAGAREFYRVLLDRVRALGGVKTAALAQSSPLGYSGAQRQIEIEGERDPATVWMNIVSNDYFDALHIPLISGRAFDERDTASSGPVAIVNEELAKRGTRIRMNGRLLEVVGVARTAKYFSLGEAPRPYFYLPFSQNCASRMVLHIETAGRPGELARAAVDVIHSIDAAQIVSEVRPLSEYIARGATFQARVALDAVAAVGLCGLALALAGLYGVVSHTVNARRREIGIRLALGAGRRRVIAWVLAGGIRMALIGTIAGIAASLAARRLIAGLIPGAAFGETLPLVTAAALVMLTAAAACLGPAWRAANIYPARSLRE